MKKNICIITGSRAEYGLLKNLINQIHKSKYFKYQLVCTGSHLGRKTGNTINEILQDGYKIEAKIPILSKTSSALDVCNSTGKCIQKVSQTLHELKPEIVIVLGDRFEIFASAIAATILNIPIAHIHGGEITQGAIDEAFRHSISKMSYFHFVAAEEYKNRVIQLGEHKSRVFNVGGMGVDAIKNIELFSRGILEERFPFIKDSKYFMITFHPETLNTNNQLNQLTNLFNALEEFSNFKLIFTSSNVDTGGDEINNSIKNFVASHKNAFLYKSLGQKLYFSLVSFCSGVIGNSSSGILEAPYFNVGTVNIGNRQKGRLMSSSIINTKPKKSEIKNAIEVILSKKYNRKLKNTKHPFGNGGASKKIYNILEKKLLSKSEINLNKKFFDTP